MTIWVHTWWHLLEAQHWIDSPFLAQVTYTCVSISAGGHAACSAPYSLRFLVLRTLVAPESSAAPPLLRLYWHWPPCKMQAAAPDRRNSRREPLVDPESSAASPLVRLSPRSIVLAPFRPPLEDTCSISTANSPTRRVPGSPPEAPYTYRKCGPCHRSVQ